MNTLTPALDRFLTTMEFPAMKDDLIREGTRAGLAIADRAQLDRLPEQRYDGRLPVREALAAQADENAELVAA
ncbi:MULTISPECIES: DUF2795 domain-containing protein [unclassified Microbacterium]|uniref:DUF2795 domain-containing protein n=1 Tax=unclassified Microbacterium TaxID=2609290 RepID=UPI0012FAE974|nr:DUF2795 domain-containing protein [Microbacterium sp. MAH-37]MVQ41525.1 DUF2795 domain-containing protein [Microbacterium sp. MAH-37]